MKLIWKQKDQKKTIVQIITAKETDPMIIQIMSITKTKKLIIQMKTIYARQYIRDKQQYGFGILS